MTRDEKVEIEEHQRISDTEGADLESAEKTYTNASGLVVSEELRKRRARITYVIFPILVSPH
jgi:hypothetical protein